MRLRGAYGPDPTEPDPAEPDPAEPDPADSTASWRVRPALTWVRVAGTVLLLVLAVAMLGDPTKVAAALVGAAVAGAFALRDLLIPVRLAADPDGVTVATGFAGRRRLPWSQIEQVRVDTRQRLSGLSSRLLEVDTGDNLYLFSSYDLNAELDDVVAELERLRG